MQSASSHSLVQFSRWLLVLLLPLLLFTANSSRADRKLQARPMPPSLVLVLKLVSRTHVKPTTGIVIADDGLVLVPADFVSSEGEIIVLDGGNDIVKNGRPATVLHPALNGGLAVLSVKGLSRPGVTLSGNGANEGPGLHMVAFPPAEFIAKGAPPLWVALELAQGEPGQPRSIAPATPQPYIFGAILNECGYLVGVSSTTGPQSLQHTEQPANIFVDELQSSLALRQMSLPVASCKVETQQAAAPAASGTNSTDSISADTYAGQTETVDKSAAVRRPAVVRKRLNPFQGAVPQGAQQNAPKPSVWRTVPVWLLLVGLVMLGALAWKAVALFRMTRPGNAPAAVGITGLHTRADIEEPDTEPLENADNTLGRPRSAPEFDLEGIDTGQRPEGCDAVLVVAGRMGPETRFKRFCFVNSANIDIVIGRTGADINIDSPAISRVHVRIESAGEQLTITDLGSRNGTSVRDIPCLPGEVFFFGPEDEIFLGDIQLEVYLNRQEAEWA
ncbi:MAG: FHA domain-containing protein [Gammaproteobacteria bacterium]|nr:FHA domain-containing protein [Gammaproteobacteria bacterium]